MSGITVGSDRSKSGVISGNAVASGSTNSSGSTVGIGNAVASGSTNSSGNTLGIGNAVASGSTNNNSGSTVGIGNAVASGSTIPRKRKVKESECDKSLQCLQTFIASRMEKKHVEDEDDMFAKMVATEMKKIKSGKTKRGLKKKITDLLYETLEQEEEEPLNTQGQQVVLPNGDVISVVIERREP